MPNIPEFEARAADQGLRPDQAGSEAFAQAGRHSEAVFNELGRSIGGAVSEIGGAWERHTTLQANLTTIKLTTAKAAARQQEWAAAMAQDAAAPVHNPNLLQDHLQKWAKEDEDFSGTLPTEESRAFATEHQLSSLQGIRERGMADMATLAGHQAVLDYTQTGNYAQSVAYNDPTAANQMRGVMAAAHDAAVANLGVNATPQAIAALDAEKQAQATALTLAQGRGTIDNAVDAPGATPGTAAKAALHQFMASPEAQLYLNQAQRDELLAYGDRQAKAKEADAWAQEEHAHRQDVWQSQTVMGQYQTVLSAGLKPGGTVPADFDATVMKDQRLMPGDRDALVGLHHRMATEAANIPTAPGVLHTLLGRVTLPDSDPHRLTPNEVLQHIGVDLSRADGDFLLERLKPAAEAHDRFANIMLDQAMREARAYLAPHDNLVGTDPAVKAIEEHNISAFESWFIPAYQDGIRAGKTPQQLLDPNSADYLLKGNRVAGFATSTAPGAGPGPAPGSAAAPIGGTPPKQDGGGIGGFISGLINGPEPAPGAPRGPDWADKLAEMIDGSASPTQGGGPGQMGPEGRKEFADFLRRLGTNPLGAIFGGDQAGQRIPIAPQVMDEVNRIRRQQAARGQVAPEPGTAGATATSAAPAQTPTLSQDQVDGLLFGKPNGPR